MNQCEHGSKGYYLLKKWNRLLTKDDDNFDNEPVYNSRFKTKLNRKDILNMILKEFPIPNEVYYLKEKFKFAVANFDYETTKTAYDTYLRIFKESNIKEYNEFISILENWKEEILNSFLRPYGDHKLSNALTEIINGKLDTYLEISHGIMILTRFRNRVLYALNPHIYYSISSTLTSNAFPDKARGKYKKIKE